MGSARSAERAFFPLDEELALLPGTLTPNLQEDLVRLGAWMPFGRAAQELQHFRGVAVSRPTAERLTEAAGAAYVTFQTAELGKVDEGGGGTIAYIMANYNMEVIDSGVAVLNMHAPWEITSKVDIYETYNGYIAFLKDM